MPFAADLRTYLLTKTAITDLVGQRVYPKKAPQGAAFPRITYRVISADHWRSHQGSSQTVEKRIQIDAWSNDNDECDELAEAIRMSLDGYKGLFDELEVYAVFLLSEQDLYESPKDATDTGVYHVAMDFSIAHEESDPTL